MTDTVCYRTNLSRAPQIAAHLRRADSSFEPSLSSRVIISDYSRKLQDNAIRFEAWVNSDLIGLVAAYFNQGAGGAAFVTSVSVLVEFQGRGIAARLLRQCIEYVANLGCSRVELEVEQGNLPAVMLYQRLGFSRLNSRGSALTMGMELER